MFGIEDYSQKIVDYSNPDGFSGIVADWGEALTFGGTMLLIGMLTIFGVLALLWACLTVFKAVFSGVKEKPKAVAPAVSVTPVAQPVSSADDEIVAVIAAAIATAESESSGLKFRVVSFKRK